MNYIAIPLTQDEFNKTLAAVMKDSQKWASYQKWQKKYDANIAELQSLGEQPETDDLKTKIDTIQVNKKTAHEKMAKIIDAQFRKLEKEKQDNC
jgi:hypothetical protein